VSCNTLFSETVGTPQKMTTTDWTTKRNELSALFKAFYELFSYENDVRLKRIEDKSDQVLRERVRPWTAATKAKAAERPDSKEMLPVLTDSGYIRLSQIRKYYVPVSQSTRWQWIRSGTVALRSQSRSEASQCGDPRTFVRSWMPCPRANSFQSSLPGSLCQKVARARGCLSSAKRPPRRLARTG
jgi:hypothetical protein